MCKFTNRLFVFTLLALVMLMASVDAAAMRAQHRSAAEPKFLDLLSLSDDNNNYDLHYDQRQKGEENLHVRMNGIFIEMADDEDKSDDIDELKELLLYAIMFGGSEEMFKQLLDNKISATSVLNENKLETDRHAGGQPSDEVEVTTKPKIEGRNVDPHKGSGLLGVKREPETNRVGLITKQHFNTLLSLLKRMRRN
ncbi:uncharacterized protein LOC105211412 [Zeugodacus cucurbitae]|uniref:uncharacterized protein LOC105211412 n=1 Tax=Zeugodacus cucurbitae TaxID=28588 RepID=UPI0023D9502B|nr:uncharacterized protein LOC105211412 [Zeugodacus cucurbitae]